MSFENALKFKTPIKTIKLEKSLLFIENACKNSNSVEVLIESNPCLHIHNIH